MTFIVTLIDRAISSEVGSHLGRRVSIAVGLAPDQAEAACLEIVADRAVSEDIDRRRRDRHHLLAFVDELVELPLQLFAIEARVG